MSDPMERFLEMLNYLKRRRDELKKESEMALRKMEVLDTVIDDMQLAIEAESPSISAKGEGEKV